jgi:transposase
LIERNETAFNLWQDGMTQREIAAILDGVDRTRGGTGVSHAMVQKMLARMRSDREEQLLSAASS